MHKLVAKLFLPNPENYKKLIFIDGNRQNCKVENLKWVSNAEFADILRSRPNAYSYRPDFKPNAKLTPTKVAMLKKLINDPNRKTRYKIIAKRFDIDVGTLFSIKRGDSWKEIKPAP